MSSCVLEGRMLKLENKLVCLEVELMKECRTLLSNLTLQGNVEYIWVWNPYFADMCFIKEVCVLLSNFKVKL